MIIQVLLIQELHKVRLVSNESRQPNELTSLRQIHQIQVNFLHLNKDALQRCWLAILDSNLQIEELKAVET